MRQGAISPTVRRAVATEWAFRAAAERAQEARFERLAVQLTALGATAATVAYARDAAADEARHAVLCADTAARFDVVPLPEVPEHTFVLPRATARARLLYELVSVGCVTETLNACVLTATLARVTDPAVRRTVHTILRDEVRHSRLGWAWLEEERSRLDVAFLGPLLPGMLAATFRAEFFVPVADDPEQEALAAYGNVAARERLPLAMAVLDDVVFPGLDAAGVPTEAARVWRRERVSARPGEGPV